MATTRAETKDVVEALTETGAVVVQGPFGVSEATAGAVMPGPIAVDPDVLEPQRSAWRESGKKTEEKAAKG